MDNIITVSDDYSITLNLNLRKRLGDPSVYRKNNFESRKIFLVDVYRNQSEYLVIHTGADFEQDPGYAYSTYIDGGKIKIPKSFEFFIKPGQRLLWDGTIYPPMPIWLKVL